MPQAHPIVILHNSAFDANDVVALENQIRFERAEGRNVVVVCNRPKMRRAERLMLVSVSAVDLPGQYAVVTDDMRVFVDTLPPAIAAQCRLFPTAAEAMNWMTPTFQHLCRTQICTSRMGRIGQPS